MLVGTDTKKIIKAMFDVNNDVNEKSNQFGEGNSTESILKILK